jgi:hypothetical protein
VERGYLRRGKRIRRREVCEWEGFVYYESRKRELKRRLINEGRCDERLSIYMRHRGWEEKKVFLSFKKTGGKSRVVALRFCACEVISVEVAGGGRRGGFSATAVRWIASRG